MQLDLFKGKREQYNLSNNGKAYDINLFDNLGDHYCLSDTPEMK